MRAILEAQEKWSEVARVMTAPTEANTIAEVRLDSYYLVVGFEVNNETAFQNETHDLAFDYGHAFFYIVKNRQIVMVLSFGPTKGQIESGKFAKDNQNKDDTHLPRLGTPDYRIYETVRAFKINLSIEEASRLMEKTAKMREAIKEKRVKYSAIINDTCAETAKEVLDDAGIVTPSGSGKIKHSEIVNFPLAYAVNPYKWYHNFKRAGHQEVSYELEQSQWMPSPNTQDPIFR